jgi:hypothetical protein
VGRGAQLAGAAVLPFGGAWQWVGVVLLAGVLGAAAVLRRHLPIGEGVRAELGRWLAIAGAGVLVALAAWAVYVPAPDHYSPTALGTVNRMNAGAAIGVAILVYSCIVLLMSMLALCARLRGSVAALGATALALALGGAYVRQSTADARAWDAAAADQRRLLADMHAALSRLPQAAIVYVFDAPLLVGPGIPVLNTTLDLTSAMRIAYSSPALVGVPVVGEASVACGSKGPLAGEVGGAYGSSYVVDIGSRRAVRLISRTQCALCGSHSARSPAERALPGPMSRQLRPSASNAGMPRPRAVSTSTACRMMP